jgi:hypothetical protein
VTARRYAARCRRSHRGTPDPEIAAEAPLRQVWEIEPADDGTCRLTVVTEGLIAGTKSAEEFEGGIVLSVFGLKTMLETGDSLAAAGA